LIGFSHHEIEGVRKRRCGANFTRPVVEERKGPTVDGNGNALGENVAIGTLKGRDFTELVELQILGRDTLGRLSVDNLELEVVCLCDCEDGGAAGVTL